MITPGKVLIGWSFLGSGAVIAALYFQRQFDSQIPDSKVILVKDIDSAKK